MNWPPSNTPNKSMKQMINATDKYLINTFFELKNDIPMLNWSHVSLIIKIERDINAKYNVGSL